MNESFFASYILTYVILVLIFLTKVSLEIAVFGALFYALLLNFFTVSIFAFLDEILL